MTGAASGIGEAAATALAAHGWEVWLGCRTAERAEQAAARIVVAAAEQAESLGRPLAVGGGASPVEAHLDGGRGGGHLGRHRPREQKEKEGK